MRSRSIALSIRRRRERIGLATALAMATLISHPAWAALPTVDQPTSGGSNSNWLTTLQGYTRDTAQIATLVIGFGGLAAVAYSALTSFMEYRRGKEELGEVLTKSGVGVALVMFVTFMLSLATGII